jgi:heptosyltransferase-2
MSAVAKILFVSLSNIGDAIMTLPSLDRLKADHPQAAITVVSGPRPQELFIANPAVAEVIVYDKHCRLREKIGLIRRLRAENFDLVVDLRNSIFGLFVPAAQGPSWLPRSAPDTISHSVQRHLRKLGPRCTGLPRVPGAEGLSLKAADQRYIDELLAGLKPAAGQPLVVCSAGARSDIKRWPQAKWVALINRISAELGARVILVGDKDDVPVNAAIAASAVAPLIDLSGRTSLHQLACLLKKASLVVTNDSANMHLASYLDVPVVAVFGPTDERVYGPWSGLSRVVCRQIFCRPCRKAQCRFKTLACMQLVSSDDVFRAVKAVLRKEPLAPPPAYKRILVMRSDKIGDVVLSTPVLESLRRAFPNAYISLLVRPYTVSLVKDNPFIDGLLVYDKQRIGRNPLRTLSFVLAVRRQRFDCVLILNPSVRTHIIAFLAGIPRRVGYDSKAGFLLTDRVANTKHEGRKHESEYTLDLLRALGVDPGRPAISIVLNPEILAWADEYLDRLGIAKGSRFCMINPGTNDLSRVWSPQRYAEVADSLVRDRGCKVIITSGRPDAAVARQVLGHMRQPGIDVIDKTSLIEQAAIISRCSLFISPDTGPMHIASALGVPVIALFGRKDPGVGPQRWGPLSAGSRVVQKDVGCRECPAHKCRKGFLCLQAIGVEDVLAAIDHILLDK